jgi:hypothetical protein
MITQILNQKRFKLACVLLTLASSSLVEAKELIIMPMHTNDGNIVKNLGDLPDAEIRSAGRAMPKVVESSVGGNGYALAFTQEQTGRPGYYQSVEIDSDGTDNLQQWSLTLWFKTDFNKVNPDNQVAQFQRNTLFSTMDDGKAGIFLGTNLGNTKDFAQLYIRTGDGTNVGAYYCSFAPGDLSERWRFIAIIFDGTQASNRLTVYAGDEFGPAKKLLVDPTRFDKVQSTGDSPLDTISIGDGFNAFRDLNSHNGLIDNIFMTDDAMDYEMIEEIRQAALR